MARHIARSGWGGLSFVTFFYGNGGTKFWKTFHPGKLDRCSIRIDSRDKHSMARRLRKIIDGNL